MRLNPDRVLAKARQTTTEELLDAVTVLRSGMEPYAVEILEAELARRGFGPEEIQAHDRQLKHQVVRLPDGSVANCTFCRRAAIYSRRDWHRWWGLLPLIPRTFYYCANHWEKRGQKRQAIQGS